VSKKQTNKNNLIKPETTEVMAKDWALFRITEHQGENPFP